MNVKLFDDNIFSDDQSHLINKYGINNPPQMNNAFDKAIQAAEATMARAARVTGDTGWLFDHVCNPAMSMLANETIERMHRQYGDFLAGIWDSAVFLYYAGNRDLRAYGSDIERFAYLMSYAGRNGCDIRLAPGGCTKGQTALLPLQRGQFLIVFEACAFCENWAWETAEMNFKASVLAAQDDLPPGAVIDPRSPVAPRLD